MIRLPARHALLAAAAAVPVLAVPLAAQEAPGAFSLPPASPAPTPAPAGPADERGGVAIPPRAVPEPTPTPTPTVEPLPSPGAVLPPVTLPAPRESAPPARTGTPAPAPAPAAPPSAPTASPIPPTAPAADPGATVPGAAPATPAAGAILPDAGPLAGSSASPDAATQAPSPLPEWWPFAAGGLAGLVLLGGGAVWRRRRKPRVLRLAAPAAPAEGAAPDAAAAGAPPRLDLALEIVSATRSIMMFTLAYRLTIANRSDRAVNDLNAAARLACARGDASGAPSAGAAQGLETIARIGPHQARSLTGTLQLPLSAIAPLRQGQTPLFIPLVHVTLEAEGLPADTRTFVIGTPSPSGRVHPILLDQPPGGIAGLVAQAVALPAASAAA